MPSAIIIPRSFRPKMCYRLVHRLPKEILILTTHRAHMVLKIMDRTRPIVVPPHVSQVTIPVQDVSSCFHARSGLTRSYHAGSIRRRIRRAPKRTWIAGRLER